MFGFSPFASAPFTSIGAEASTDYTLSCNTGYYSVVGNDLIITFAHSLSCDTGYYSVVGNDAEFSIARFLACDIGSYAVIGKSANLLFQYAGYNNNYYFTTTNEPEIILKTNSNYDIVMTSNAIIYNLKMISFDRHDVLLKTSSIISSLTMVTTNGNV